ncbi:Mitochondrial GTP/GDP carrier protein 1 [Diplonema papillatum]|nr:Mitochondrial GTP/GDP carrier protein 1 [Diplonema papillatum]
MSPPSSSTSSSQTAFGRFAGAGCAGVAELLIFHPVDTVAKRLMNSKVEFNSSNARQLLFQEHANAGVLKKYGSLFPGIGYGAVYKILQRVYKFGGQPYVKEFMQKAIGKPGKESKTQSFLLNGLSGSVMGAGEVVLLPFDVMKIKAQTNPEYRKMTMSAVMKQEGMQLYAGWQWTMARNVPGSFALFGGNALAKEMMGLADHRDATLLQTSLSSLAGSVSSIIVACPLDVVKTRIQSGSFGKEGGVSIIKTIMKEEGPGAFFKGSIPKVVTVGPKLIFSFTVAQYLMAMWERR